MKLGITEYIDCAHHLADHEKCGSPHGHTYRIDISIESEHKGAMILDFSEFKKSVRGVLSKYDHHDWNAYLEVPTVENICELLHNDLKRRLKYKVQVRVWEGQDKWAEL